MRERLIQAALGEQPPELLLKNARVLNVLTGEILRQNIAIAGERIAGLGDYERGERTIDLEGAYVVPGFVNSHCHVESSLVDPATYCTEELRWGVTTLITDPHEIANVAGEVGIRYMLERTADLPTHYYVMAPSCVPSTPFEHAGACLDAKALAPFLAEERVLGLGEMMDYPGLFARDPDLMRKLTLFQDRIIDGHAPGVGGRRLQAYAAAGIHTDHESTSFEEALEKLRAGIAVLVREGSASRNLEALMRGIVAHHLEHAPIAFCTDDKHIADIRREGTIRCHIRRSIEMGLGIPEAYRMASHNAARIYGLSGIGAVAPGYFADLVVLGDLREVEVRQVFLRGRRVDPDAMERRERPPRPASSVHITALREASFTLPGLSREGDYPAIRIVPGEILTERVGIPIETITPRLGEGSLNKLAVIERHRATGSMGVGLLEGYGLRRGALASTVGHDSHNLLVVGTRDEDMRLAAEEAARMGGGFVLVDHGQIIGALPLPLYGLMSDAPLDAFIPRLESLRESAHAYGVPRSIDPFVTLSFLALPVIPSLRLTDQGLFDVDAFSFVFEKKSEDAPHENETLIR